MLKKFNIAPGGKDGMPVPDAALLVRRHRRPAIQLKQGSSRYFVVHRTDAAWAAAAWLAAPTQVPFPE